MLLKCRQFGPHSSYWIEADQSEKFYFISNYLLVAQIFDTPLLTWLIKWNVQNTDLFFLLRNKLFIFGFKFSFHTSIALVAIKISLKGLCGAGGILRVGNSCSVQVAAPIYVQNNIILMICKLFKLRSEIPQRSNCFHWATGSLGPYTGHVHNWFQVLQWLSLQLQFL